MKYVSILSGGLDSVVNLYIAASKGEVVQAITFDYGQRAAQREIEAAKYFCSELKVPHQIIELNWLSSLTNTALVNRKENLPKLKNLDDLDEGNASAEKVWVPNRNGVFLNIAASFAESLKAEFVVPGFNKEEAVTFPDNSQKFIDTCDAAFSLSTMNKVKVKCFTTDLDKVGMVKKAQEFKIDFKKLWSCYQDGEEPCLDCESCQRTVRALEIMGL